MEELLQHEVVASADAEEASAGNARKGWPRFADDNEALLSD